MATINITPLGPGKHMVVDNQLVAVKKGDTITFNNALTSPQSDVYLQFFKYPDAKTSANVVDDFCTVMDPAEDAFVVPKSAGATCTVSSTIDEGAAYNYTIEAKAAAWNKLDPVIIIETAPTVIPILPAIIIAAGGAAVGALGMKMYAAMKRKKQKQGEPAS